MRRIALLIAAALVMYGCATIKAPEVSRDTLHGAASPQSINAQAIVELKRAFSVRGRATVLVRSPDSFRIVVTGPFDQPMAVLSGDAESLFVYTAGKTEVYGWEDPDMPYPFTSKELVSVLLGDARVVDHGNVRYDVTGGRDAAVVITKLNDGDRVLRISMDDFREVAGKKLPFHITIEDKKSAIQIRYTSVEIDPEIKDSAFDMAPGPGTLP